MVITITAEGRRLRTDRRTLRTHALAESIGRLTDDERRMSAPKSHRRADGLLGRPATPQRHPV